MAWQVRAGSASGAEARCLLGKSIFGLAACGQSPEISGAPGRLPGCLNDVAGELARVAGVVVAAKPEGGRRLNGVGGRRRTASAAGRNTLLRQRHLVGARVRLVHADACREDLGGDGAFVVRRAPLPERLDVLR
ncbi:hypothetical protein KBZ94_38290 [Streptomyces sp. RM72]|nr:hypothetical protein [Streptomyces sp. RM72]